MRRFALLLLLLPASLGCRRAQAPAPAPDATLAPLVLDVPISPTGAVDAATTAQPGQGPARTDAATTAAAPAAPEDPREELTARTYDVLLDGSTIYRATTAGVVVEDAAEPEKPRRLGVLFLPGSVDDLAWLGRVAPGAASACAAAPDGGAGCAGPAIVLAAAAGPAGVYLIEVTDPEHPAELGRYDTPGAAMGLAAAGSLLFVADGTSGVLALDVRDPAHPQLAGGTDGPPPAAATAPTAGVAAANVPSTVPPQPAGLYARDVAVVGSRLYVAGGFAGLLVYDVRDGGRPAGALELDLRFVVDTPGDARAVVPDGDTVFVADGPAGLQVIDVGPGSLAGGPHIVATVPTRDICRGVALDLARDKSLFPPAAYLSVGDRGLQILDVADFAAPRPAGAFVPAHPVNRATIGPNGLVLLANDSAGLMIVDASDPGAVRQIFPPVT